MHGCLPFNCTWENRWVHGLGKLVSKIPYCGSPFGTGVYHLHNPSQLQRESGTGIKEV